MDEDLALWNGLFHDGAIVTMKGPVPGDIEVIVQPGLLGDLRFKVAGTGLFLDSGRPISYDELAHSCNLWWHAWKERNQL